MSRLIQRFVAFLDPRPTASTAFKERMDESLNRAEVESNAAIIETQKIREIRRTFETMSDRIILDPPRRREMRHERS